MHVFDAQKAFNPITVPLKSPSIGQDFVRVGVFPPMAQPLYRPYQVLWVSHLNELRPEQPTNALPV